MMAQTGLQGQPFHDPERLRRVERLGPCEVEWLTATPGVDTPDAPAHWQAVLLKTGPFPLERTTIAWLDQFLRDFDAAVLAQMTMPYETFLQFSYLYVGDCATLLQAHARDWKPRMGLGVYPDQPPPKLWEAEELKGVPTEGMTMRPLSHTVLRTVSDVKIQHEVAGACLVSGSVLRFYAEDVGAFLKAAKAFCLPRLTASVHRGHTFYVPLLSAASFRGADDDDLEQWLPRVGAYLGESHPDQGVVVAFRGELDRLLWEMVKHEEAW